MPNYSRLIIKVGTNTLTGADDKLDESYLSQLVAQICEAGKQSEVALVTSGAIRVGLTALGLTASRSLRESQAAAAGGQGLLMHHYQKLFQEHDRLVAQVLLTNDGMHNRNRYLNARNTLLTLFEKRVIPIINENDEEIGRGLTNYSAAEVSRIKGVHSRLLEQILGYRGDPEVIHRDNLLVYRKG